MGVTSLVSWLVPGRTPIGTSPRVNIKISHITKHTYMSLVHIRKNMSAFGGARKKVTFKTKLII